MNQFKEDAASDVGKSPSELGDIASDEFKDEIITLDVEDSSKELTLDDDDSSKELSCPDYLNGLPNALTHLEMKVSQLKEARAQVRRERDAGERELRTKEKKIFKLRRRISEMIKANVELSRKLKSTGNLLQTSMLNELKLELKIEDEKKRKIRAQELVSRRKKKREDLKLDSKMGKPVSQLKEELEDLQKKLRSEACKQAANSRNPLKNPYDSKEGENRKRSLKIRIRNLKTKIGGRGS